MNSEYVYINEVGPRDGLQNQETILSSEIRLNLINHLIGARLPGIEVASFVSPKAVPAMEGAREIVQSLADNAKGCEISVLVPNMKGFEMAAESGAEIITIVPSATETMNKKNINMGLEEAIKNSCNIIKSAKNLNLRTRAYVSVAWECPYEGRVKSSTVLNIANQLLSAGADEIILARHYRSSQSSKRGVVIQKMR